MKSENFHLHMKVDHISITDTKCGKDEGGGEY